MSSLLQITLGVLTAMGGFVDIGELVFSVQAGVRYGYALLWAVLLGTIGIILFTELSGRIAAVTKKPLFLLIKERLPKPLAITVLVASTILNALTCAAEIGGVAITLQLLLGIENFPALIITVGCIIGIIWLLPYKYLEKLFGLLGLFMIIFIVAIFATHVNLLQAAHGLIPSLPQSGTQSLITYAYFAVGIISSCMMPYEVYFYSSGGIEEKWTPKDLFNNFMTSNVGMTLGALVSGSLLILGGSLLKPHGIIPQLHGSSALLATIPFGKTGLIIALFGILFTISGAAVETGLAGGYNIAQYFGWSWGVHKKPKEAKKFTAVWVGIFILAFFILILQIDPVELVEYAVIFSLLALPFTYYVALKVGRDKKAMGEHVTKSWVNLIGWIYLALITIIAIVAVPLMILSNMGNG